MAVTTNSKINLIDINSILNTLITKAKQCACNCNWCNCECNYCTCDTNICTCNSQCSCDCNYCACDCNYGGCGEHDSDSSEC